MIMVSPKPHALSQFPCQFTYDMGSSAKPPIFYSAVALLNSLRWQWRIMEREVCHAWSNLDNRTWTWTILPRVVSLWVEDCNKHLGIVACTKIDRQMDYRLKELALPAISATSTLLHHWPFWRSLLTDPVFWVSPSSCEIIHVSPSLN